MQITEISSVNKKTPNFKKNYFSLRVFLFIIVLVNICLYFSLPYLNYFLQFAQRFFSEILFNIILLLSFLALFFPSKTPEKEWYSPVNWRLFICGWLLFVGSFYQPWVFFQHNIEGLYVAYHSFMNFPFFLVCNILIFFSLEFATSFQAGVLLYSKVLLLIGYLLWIPFAYFQFHEPFLLMKGYPTWLLSFGMISLALSWKITKKFSAFRLFAFLHIFMAFLLIIYRSFFIQK